MAREQYMTCKDLYVGTSRSLFDKKFYVNWRKNGVTVYRDTREVENGKEIPLTAESAIQWANEGAEHGVFMFCSGPIPCNGNQHGVYYYNCAGIGKEIPTKYKYDHEKVEKAKKSVFIQTIGKPVIEQVISKPEVPRIVLSVQYSPDSDVYSFYACATHYIGDFVGVGSKDGDVNVKVVAVAVMTAADVKRLLGQINNRIKEKGGMPIKDLSSIKSDEPFITPVAWTKWNEEDIPEKYRQTGDTDGDIPEYSSEEEYFENTAELEAMRECFQPVADIVYPGDLPDPEPDEVWCNNDQINEAEEPEVSDLPE